MQSILTAGDYIWYIEKNEIGVVKRVTDDGCFAWFHSGDTASHIHNSKFEKMLPWNVAENAFGYTNSRDYKSLAKRRIDILSSKSRTQEE